MELPYFHIDAFTRTPFSGNPAGVCILERWLPDEVLLGIAAENNLSETAFVIPSGPGSYGLRWFTPRVEMDLCGHATLATAHVLFCEMGWAGDHVAFETRSGLVSVQRVNGLLELDFPSRPPEPCNCLSTLEKALGRPPVAAAKSRDYMAVFECEDDVSQLRPDFEAIVGLGVHAVIATAPGWDCDFVSRFFAPAVGVPEDPVTGSAHCTLIPYWSARLGKKQLHAKQLSARRGELVCEDRGERVGIAGGAVTFSKGTIRL